MLLTGSNKTFNCYRACDSGINSCIKQDFELGRWLTFLSASFMKLRPKMKELRCLQGCSYSSAMGTFHSKQICMKSVCCHSPFQRKLQTKFGKDWPTGSWPFLFLKLLTNDGWNTTIAGPQTAEACLRFKLTMWVYRSDELINTHNK